MSNTYSVTSNKRPPSARVPSGTTAEIAAYTGAEGEITLDDDTGTFQIHDGSTAGGTTVSPTTLDGVVIGGTTRAAGNFTTVAVTSASPTVLLNLNDTTSNNVQFGTAADKTYIGTTSNTAMTFQTNSLERARFTADGNFLLGGTATPTSSVGNFVLYNGTAPTGSATNGIVLYAEDVTASSELKVRDEAGNVTTLSPHNFSLIPDGPSEDMAWGYYSERDGKAINVDILAVIRAVENLTGKTFVYQTGE